MGNKQQGACTGRTWPWFARQLNTSIVHRLPRVQSPVARNVFGLVKKVKSHVCFSYYRHNLFLNVNYRHNLIILEQHLPFGTDIQAANEEGLRRRAPSAPTPRRSRQCPRSSASSKVGLKFDFFLILTIRFKLGFHAFLSVFTLLCVYRMIRSNMPSFPLYIRSKAVSSNIFKFHPLKEYFMALYCTLKDFVLYIFIISSNVL